MYTGGQARQLATQLRPAAHSAVARTGRWQWQSSAKGIKGAATEASIELIIHKHAGLCPTEDSGWHTCSEMPIPRTTPQHGGISALQHEALGEWKGCCRGVPAHKLLGADENWQKQRLGFGFFSPERVPSSNKLRGIMFLVYLSRELSARGLPKKKGWPPACLEMPIWEVGGVRLGS